MHNFNDYLIRKPDKDGTPKKNGGSIQSNTLKTLPRTESSNEQKEDSCNTNFDR